MVNKVINWVERRRTGRLPGRCWYSWLDGGQHGKPRSKDGVRSGGRVEKEGQRTVEAMAAGTFAMIDMTGLRFNFMKI